MSGSLWLRVARWLAFCTVFFGLPGLIVWRTAHQVAEEMRQHEASQVKPRLEKFLAHWQIRFGEIKEVGSFLNNLTRAALQHPDPRPAIATIRRLLRRHQPGLFSLVYLDGQGRLVHDLSDPVPGDPAAWQAFFLDYRAHQDRPERHIDRPPAVYRSLFGPLFGRQNDLEIREKLVPACFRSERTRVLVSRATAQGLLVAFFHQRRGWREACFRFWLALRRNTFPDLWFGLIDRGAPRPERSFSPGPGRSSLSEALIRLEAETGSLLDLHGIWWSQVALSPILRLVVAAPDRTAKAREQALNRFVKGLLLVVALLSGVAWLLSEGGTTLPFSIRRKVWLLLGWLSVSAFFLLGLALHGYRREVARLAWQEDRRERESLLRDLDRRFLAYLGALTADIRRTLAQADPEHLPQVRQALARLDWRHRPKLLLLVDREGRNLYPDRHPWHWREHYVPTMLRYQAQHLLGDLTGEAVAARSSGAAQMFAATAELYGVHPDLFQGQVRLSVDHLADLRLANSGLKSLIVPLRRGNRISWLAIFAWLTPHLEGQFARSILPRQPCPDPRDLPFIWAKIDRFLPNSKAWIERLEPIRRHLEHTREPVCVQVDGPDRVPYVVTGIPGTHLAESFLFLVRPQSAIMARQPGGVGPLIGLAALLLLVSASMGLLLARRFLAPIDHLRQGIQALHDRQFRVQLPVLAQDEFGALTTTFNTMLEGLGDLELARLIQENLFPAGTLRQNDWEVAGRCLPAARVGGDFYDFFPLDDRTVALVVGDVSGHGVGAALVVAMAKALLAVPAGRPTPAAVLDLLHGFLKSHLRQKKLMTCWFGVVDTRSGLLCWSNAGHCYPYLVTERTARHLEPSGYPLGIRTRTTWREWTVEMSRGSALVLYTDGVIEATTLHGRPLGFDRPAEALPGLLGATATDSVTRIFHWWKDQTGGATLQDDATLVVLQAPAVGTSPPFVPITTP
ncbi:MAG: Serine phosphatase RsbU, regulator of sigma subunit [Candidatus Ozemobacter sibiricus]|uniref:Serine phosphatase RsbU, regulator of sigma subunit n=1 Tax=Candidatus Ozemobacter sibiricus TaxID=2268124 RepID=A0A367ZPI0_9BACT|nr:MAG: Serine phosphatase RsbU, regulator of sigma subunit [Candidatus Ozemobacter sibiricus]